MLVIQMEKMILKFMMKIVNKNKWLRPNFAL